jgi:peptidoglycan hydrolase-like protein with peptidoglycan-binding domain
MKRLLLLIFLLGTQFVSASDEVQNLQSALKNEGFYYGEVDGKPGSELNAAIRRFQIRNGLEVTGEADEETLAALGLATEKSKAPTTRPSTRDPLPPAPPSPAATPAARPPVNLRKEGSTRESDQRFLREELEDADVPPRGPSMVRPPAPMDEDDATGAARPSSRFADIFAGTPYAKAPSELQQQTVARAQKVLASRGFYRDPIDGDPGPATEEAILTYQRSARLAMTGRLDLPTLAQLRLLPGRGTGNPMVRPYNSVPRPQFEQRPRQQVYRGVWVE